MVPGFLSRKATAAGKGFSHHLDCQNRGNPASIHPMKPLLTFLFGATALIQTARGVVTISGDINNTAPPGQPFFANVGTVNGSSGIYLGDRWVITAAHVAGSLPPNASFGGTTYVTQSGSFHRISNPVGSGLSTLTDIVVFRLGTAPALPALTLASSPPTVGADLTMIGNGNMQANQPTYWEVTSLPGEADDIWTERTPPDPAINAAGYKTNPTREIRWGDNDIETINETIHYGSGDVRAFTTSFDSGAMVQEGQAVVGDSGGAALYYNGSEWVLSGMMVAVGTFENQPGGATAAVVGNNTAIADLSYYRAEILAAIPEPSQAILVGVSTLAFLFRRRTDE